MDPRVLDKRLRRSVLSHRLGLPLLYALHDGDPATLKYLGRKRVLFTPNNERRLNGILAKAMIEWKTDRIHKEPQLTRLLVEKIIEQLNSFNAINELKVVGVEESKRETNIIFREAKSKKDVFVSTPFTVIEFGLGGIDSGRSWTSASNMSIECVKVPNNGYHVFDSKDLCFWLL